MRYARGEPQNPASDADVRKFEECTRLRLGARQVETVLGYVRSDEATVRGLFDLMENRKAA